MSINWLKEAQDQRPDTETGAGDSAVGITTTVPVEVILAAGAVPVDLNNVFISSPSPEDLIKAAERSGFPRTCCSWTKGIYGAVHRCGIKRVVAVVQGDCSNTQALVEVLEYEGVQCIPFAFPYRRSAEVMEGRLSEFAGRFGVDIREAAAWREKLKEARELVHRIDELTWREQKVYGLENHLWLVSTSDFCADPMRFRKEAEEFLDCVQNRAPVHNDVRLGLVGVPPIVPGIYEFVEDRGGHVVFNETQRQFSMPSGGDTLARQYNKYTYPYGIQCRLSDITREVRRRRLDGIIHYVQSFCYRRIEDRMIREALGVPVITLEQDRPGPLPGQVRTRLEAFVELLRARKSGRRIF